MTQRLFQDAGGTTPAIIAGQPVGLIRRLAGSVDAVQATALSKSTYARWPKTGVRNLADGAQAVGVNAYWRDTSTSNGVTMTKVGHGIEDGLPYVDCRYQGSAITASVSGVFNASALAAVAGEAFNARVSVKLVAGSIAGLASGLRVECVALNNGAYLGQSGVKSLMPTEVYQEISSGGVLDFPNMNGARTAVAASVTPGVAIDFTVRYRGLQFERGLIQTPLQFNYGPNDITEPGVKDLWHLYNDGGDSLNVTLPAGTYGLASIDINRAITITTITSDGTTPINTLRHERQLDVIIRAGAFTFGEETAIRDYWGRVFA